MRHYSFVAITLWGAVSFAPLSVQAQASVTDPQAIVPAVIYQSVFKESPTGIETQSVDWKKANADVAQFPRGHVDILKWEEAQGKARPVAKPAAPTPALPAAAIPPALHKH